MWTGWDWGEFGRYVTLAVVAGASSWVGSYYGAYWKQRGENAATQDDFKELQKQTAALTETTKQIEAEISGDAWDRQKRWELKREVLFEATRRVAAAFEALKDIENVLQTELKDPSVVNLSWRQTSTDLNAKWFQASSDLNESILFAVVICGKEVVGAIEKYRQLLIRIAAKINEKDGHIFKNSAYQVIDLRDSIKDAVRKELGVPE